MKITRNDSNNKLDDKEPSQSIVNQERQFRKELKFGMRDQQIRKIPGFKLSSITTQPNTKTSVNSTQERFNFSEIQEQDELDPESLAMQTHTTENQSFPN